ncbi:MAG: Occludin/ELL family protein [Cyanobium sp.]|jgi:hypothetical protein|nr:Occludin/ELL family protein [Synechococcaceae cyanobacterium]
MTPARILPPWLRHPTRPIVAALGLLVGALLLTPTARAQNQPGPVLCSTSLEAPPAASGTPGLSVPALVEVSRCGPVQSTAQLIERRFFSYRSPFERGVDITRQITDVLGIAMGGGDGSKLMGFGFPDQAIVWDGAAINNLYNRMLDAQSSPMPVRSPDLGNPFRSSMVMAPYSPRPLDPQPEALTGSATRPSSGGMVRGLW